MLVIGTVSFKYLVLPMGLSGRGGCVRLLCLQHGVPLEETLTTFDDWRGGGKQAAIDADEQPAGVLPIVHIEGRSYIEHVAIARYIARRLGLYGSDPEADYAADALADEYVIWRDAWGSQVLSSDQAMKDAYVAGRANHCRILEALAKRFAATGSTLALGKPSYADVLVFGMLYDDGVTNGADLVTGYPTLAAFKQAYAQLPGVRDWLAAAKA